MKQIVILILFATLFVACNNDAHDEDTVMPDLTQIGIKAKPAEKLQYVGIYLPHIDPNEQSARGRALPKKGLLVRLYQSFV